MIARSDLNPSLFSTPETSLPQRAVSRRDSETIGVSQVLRIRRGVVTLETNTGDLLCCCSSCFVYSSGKTIKLVFNILWLPYRMAIWLYRTALQRILKEYSRQSRRQKGSCQARPRPRERPVSYWVPFAALGLNHLEAYKSYETVDYSEVVP